MKKIHLSKSKHKDKFALVDDEDFENLNKWRWTICTQKHTSYAYRKEEGKLSGKHLTMHRQVLGLTDKNIFCDHKDANGLNNQKSNLRICTQSQNLRNRRKFGKSSVYKGVRKLTSGRWASYITINSKQFSLGTFGTEKQAAKAYNTKSLELFGEFSRINIL